MSHLFWYSCNIYSTLLSVVFTRVSARPCGPPRKHSLKIKQAAREFLQMNSHFSQVKKFLVHFQLCGNVVF